MIEILALATAIKEQLHSIGYKVESNYSKLKLMLSSSTIIFWKFHYLTIYSLPIPFRSFKFGM